MAKILNHKEFLISRDLSESIDFNIREYLSDFSDNELNEAKALDSIKNFLSKNLLGDFSRINILDKIRKSNLEIRKGLITSRNKTEDQIDELLLKLDKVKQSGERGAVVHVEKEIERKKSEYSALVKNKKAQIDQGEKLAEKTIGDNERRKDYFEAGLAEDHLELTKFEYELAKKRSEDPDEIKNLEKRLSSASKKAESLVNKFKSQSEKKSDVQIGDVELADISVLKKKIKEKDADTVLKIKQKTLDRSKELKEKLKTYLSELAGRIKKSSNQGLKYNQNLLDKDLDKIYDLAGEIDACDNLVSLYSKMGQNKKEISGKIKDASSLSDLFNKMNNAILDGKDAQSGLTKEMLLIEVNPEVSQIESLIKKIK